MAKQNNPKPTPQPTPSPLSPSRSAPSAPDHGEKGLGEQKGVGRPPVTKK